MDEGSPVDVVIEVRLPGRVVGLVDEAVAAGRAVSRDELVGRALEREIREWRRDESWAAHRAALLATPTLTLAELAARRGESEGATYEWLVPHRTLETLIVIPTDDEHGELVIPAFQFDGEGTPIDVVTAANRILADSRTYTRWTMWAWWHSRTGYLSGESPIDLIDAGPDRLLTAARRMAEPLQG